MSGVQDHLPINLPMQEIAAFCRRWNISQLALFGSVLRDDFGPDSDIDVLATFAPGSARTLAAVSQMQQEIEALLGRPVDLVDRQSIERNPNYLRRRAILASARTVYSAA